MTNQQKWKALSRILDQRDVYYRTLGKLSFDQSCCAPEEGLEQAGEDMAIISQQCYKITHSKRYERLITELHEDASGLGHTEQKLISRLWEEHSKVKNIPPELDYEMNQVQAKAYGVWLSAKKQSDYSLFQPVFQQLVELTRKTIDLRDERYRSCYDALLDDYEKGGSIEQLDAFFDALKARIVPLVRRIVTEGKPIREDFLTRPCPIPEQEAFSRYLLELEGLRKSALVLMTTEHPFTTNFGPQDVRVTTHYYETDFISNIFTTLHEGGHALFMQNEPAEFYALHAADGMSSAMHECISRFYENLIGRSEAFIHFIYPKLREITGDTFADVSERELYEAVNLSRPSLIRTESDELTYSLHILIRYELEKAFVNGEMSFADLPAAWNAKYREYLGVEVPDDARGILQDVHWSGSYGYFPSYALGNAYGAQILHTMKQELDVDALVSQGDLAAILAWLREKVFSIASISTPDEWIRAITGEPLNPDYYLDYLEQKFTALYEL